MTETALATITTEVITIQDFEGKDLQVKQEDDQYWLTMEECGVLLEYASPRASVSKLYGLHKREFTNDITRVVESTTSGNLRKEVREFNLEGFYLLCMHSGQPKAVTARKWAISLMGEMTRKGHVGGSQIIQITEGELERVIRQIVIVPKTDLEIKQELHHRDVVLYTDKLTQDPETFWYFNDPLRDSLAEWRAYRQGPKIGVTRITNDLFAEFWLDKKYSPDYIREVFPRDFRFLGEVEDFRKTLGLTPYKAPEMKAHVAKRIFRDKYQFEIDGGFLVRAYPSFTQRAIQRAVRLEEERIRGIFADNQVPDVERNKPSYGIYIESDVWKIIKREALIYPEGPIDRCWICFRPLALATADLHHLTYRRLGREEYHDAVPLCRKCHMYCHPEKNGLPADAENPNAVIKIKNAKFVGWHNANHKSYSCEIGPEKVHVPTFTIHLASPIKKIGDEGVLLVKKVPKYTDHLVRFAE